MAMLILVIMNGSIAKLQGLTAARSRNKRQMIRADGCLHRVVGLAARRLALAPFEIGRVAH